MRLYLMIASAALALCACHKTPGVANKVELPKRRAGLWQETVIRDGKPLAMGRTRACADPAKDSKISVFGRKIGRGMCPDHSVTREPDGAYSFTSTCDMGAAGLVTARGTARGDFQSSYHVVTQSDVSGAAFGALDGHHVTEIDVAYVGPCPAGMKAGDVLLANGMKINGDKAIAAAAALGGGQ